MVGLLVCGFEPGKEQGAGKQDSSTDALVWDGASPDLLQHQPLRHSEQIRCFGNAQDRTFLTRNGCR